LSPIGGILEDKDLGAFHSHLFIHEGLSGEVTFLVNRTTGNNANHTSFEVADGVAVVCHANGFFVEAEARHHASAFFFALYEGFSADEPGRVEFQVGQEARSPMVRFKSPPISCP